MCSCYLFWILLGTSGVVCGVSPPLLLGRECSCEVTTMGYKDRLTETFLSLVLGDYTGAGVSVT